MAEEELTVTLTNYINMCISLSTSPAELKIADIIPFDKNQDVSDKTDYRSISLLPIILKYLKRFFTENWKPLPINYFYQNRVDSENAILQKCSFKLIKELAQKCLDTSAVE